MHSYNFISFHEAISDVQPMLDHYVRESSWFGKKIFLGYSEANGWKIYELGLFDRILRGLNLAYRNTHRQFVITKLDDLTDDEILLISKNDLTKKMPGLSHKLQELCNKKIKDVGSAFKHHFHSPAIGESTDKSKKTLPIGKANAVETYKKHPEQCGKVKRMVIFQDIKHIESQGKTQQDITSVEDLMLYISDLHQVDLNHPLCARVVVDVFKQCNKETTEQLGAWLSKEKTFNPNLLKECLQVFVDKYKNQIPFSLYSIELLMTTYKKGKWNQITTTHGPLVLPTNHPLIVSAMAILIQNLPNDDKIIALTEWMMDQPEYDLQTFSTWIQIFKQKEQEKAAINLFYPLRDRMMTHFNHQWGAKHFAQLDPETANYIKSKKIGA